MDFSENGSATRRRFMALLGAVPFVMAGVPVADAAAAKLTRVRVRLRDADFDAEVEELLDSLRGYRFKLVRIEKKSPVVVLDASDRAINLVRSLPFVVSVRAEDDELSGKPETPDAPTFQVRIRRDYNFDFALEAIRGALLGVQYRITRTDPDRRILIVEFNEREMGRLIVLPAVESVIAVTAGGAGELSPIPEGETPEEQVISSRRSGTQRVIVSFSGSNRDREIRRILAALDGVRYRVAHRYAVTPAIVLEVDRRGLDRLRRLKGVRVQIDAPVPPAGDLSAPN